MQSLHVYQSLWAMERRQPDGIEWPLPEKLRRITDGGYDGISSEWTDRSHARTVAAHAAATGTGIEGVCFPRTVDALKPLLDLATELPVTHLNVQPNVMPRTVAEAVRILEGWRRLAEEVPFPVLIETHRDRMTTDLHFTLDLLDAMPDLPLLADLSHFFVGREFPVPVSDGHHAEIHRILGNSWAFHGRVASREQVQVEVSFPQHRASLDLFLGMVGCGVRQLAAACRAGRHARLHLRTRAATLCDQRRGRRRPQRPMDRRPDLAPRGPRGMGGAGGAVTRISPAERSDAARFCRAGSHSPACTARRCRTRRPGPRSGQRRRGNAAWISGR